MRRFLERALVLCVRCSMRMLLYVFCFGVCKRYSRVWKLKKGYVR